MPPRVQLYVTMPPLAILGLGVATVNTQGTPLDGVAVGSSVVATPVGDLPGGGGVLLCWVSAPNVIKLRFAGPITSGTHPFVFVWLG